MPTGSYKRPTPWLTTVVVATATLIMSAAIVGMWKLVLTFTSPWVVPAATIAGVALSRYRERTTRRAVNKLPPAPTHVALCAETLAAHAGVRLDNVVEDRPRGKARAPLSAQNAAFCSTGDRRGVLLVGTDAADSPHLQAIIAHELGHGHHNHHQTRIVTKNVFRVFRGVTVLVVASWGFVSATVAYATVLWVAVGLLAALSRRSEREADRFAVSLVGAEPVAEMFETYHHLGLGVDAPGRLDNFLASHPFTLRRATAARQT